MGTIALLAFPAAIIMAAGAFFMDKNRVAICTVAGYVCCAIPVIYVFLDIKQRAAAGDLSGIMGIYPTMAVADGVLFGIVTIINVLAYFIRRRN